MLNQSIAADLGAIRQHNDQVASLASTRELLARLAGTGPLADEQVWADYRSVDATAIAAPIVEALTARMSGVGRWQPLLRTGGPRARRCTWPTRMFDAFESLEAAKRASRAIKPVMRMKIRYSKRRVTNPRSCPLRDFSARESAGQPLMPTFGTAHGARLMHCRGAG